MSFEIVVLQLCFSFVVLGKTEKPRRGMLFLPPASRFWVPQCEKHSVNAINHRLLSKAQEALVGGICSLHPPLLLPSSGTSHFCTICVFPWKNCAVSNVTVFSYITYFTRNIVSSSLHLANLPVHCLTQHPCHLLEVRGWLFCPDSACSAQQSFLYMPLSTRIRPSQGQALSFSSSYTIMGWMLWPPNLLKLQPPVWWHLEVGPLGGN